MTKDDVIIAEKLAGDIGTTLDITDVLLVGTHEATVVGRPVVPGATVRLYVEEQTKDQKVNLNMCEYLSCGEGYSVGGKCDSIHFPFFFESQCGGGSTET